MSFVVSWMTCAWVLLLFITRLLLRRIWANLIDMECWTNVSASLFQSLLQIFKTAKKSWLIGKDSDAGRDWGQEEKGTTEDEMAGWHHWLDGREFEWTPGVGDGQGGLACRDSGGHKESDMTEQLNWTEVILNLNICAYVLL